MMFLLILCMSANSNAEFISALDNAGENEYVPVIVHMIDQVDPRILETLDGHAARIGYLQALAADGQADLIADLRSRDDEVKDIKSYWIFNGIALKAKPSVIARLRSRSDVSYISYDYYTVLDPGVESPRTPEWNISRIKADSCWMAGFSGAGVVVGIIDTGADTGHVALRGKWIPGGWYDAVNGLPGPYDDHGHGTQVLGVVQGGDGMGSNPDDIGVAPEANFIAAKGFNESGSAQLNWLHDCMQWIALQAPDVVVGAWGMTGTSTEFWSDCTNLQAIGITIAFPVGSGGPGPGTTAAPGNYPIVIGSGSTDNNDNVASFSARGPAPNQYPWNDTTFWMRPDWNLIKPDISAPGVNIRTCNTGGGYITMSGTSYSCAHSAGALAVLLSRDSTATFETLYNLLLDNADEPAQGAPYPNNNYGWGRMNIYAALQQVGIKYLDNDKPALNIKLSPNPFTRQNILSFAILFAVDGNFEIAIYDDLGALIRKVDNVMAEKGSVGNFIWDGKTDAGQYVARGVYFIIVRDQQYQWTGKVVFLD